MGIQVFCDGGARGNPGPAASAFLVIKDGDVVMKEGKFLGKATNNVAEYSAVINALSYLAKNLSSASNESEILFYLDSELVVRQLTGIYRVKDKNLSALFLKVRNLEKEIGKKIIYKHVRRNENSEADLLVNVTLDENS